MDELLKRVDELEKRLRVTVAFHQDNAISTSLIHRGTMVVRFAAGEVTRGSEQAMKDLLDTKTPYMFERDGDFVYVHDHRGYECTYSIRCTETAKYSIEEVVRQRIVKEVMSW